MSQVSNSGRGDNVSGTSPLSPQGLQSDAQIKAAMRQASNELKNDEMEYKRENKSSSLSKMGHNIIRAYVNFGRAEINLAKAVGSNIMKMYKGTIDLAKTGYKAINESKDFRAMGEGKKHDLRGDSSSYVAGYEQEPAQSTSNEPEIAKKSMKDTMKGIAETSKAYVEDSAKTVIKKILPESSDFRNINEGEMMEHWRFRTDVNPEKVEPSSIESKSLGKSIKESANQIFEEAKGIATFSRSRFNSINEDSSGFVKEEASLSEKEIKNESKSGEAESTVEKGPQRPRSNAVGSQEQLTKSTTEKEMEVVKAKIEDGVKVNEGKINEAFESNLKDVTNLFKNVAKDQLEKGNYITKDAYINDFSAGKTLQLKESIIKDNAFNAADLGGMLSESLGENHIRYKEAQASVATLENPNSSYLEVTQAVHTLSEISNSLRT